MGDWFNGYIFKHSSLCLFILAVGRKMVHSHSTTIGGGKWKKQTKMEEVVPPISKEGDIIIDVDTMEPPSSRAVMVPEVTMDPGIVSHLQGSSVPEGQGSLPPPVCLTPVPSSYPWHSHSLDPHILAVDPLYSRIYSGYLAYPGYLSWRSREPESQWRLYDEKPSLPPLDQEYQPKRMEE